MTGQEETSIENSTDKRAKTNVTVEEEEQLVQSENSPKEDPSDKQSTLNITEALETMLHDASKEVSDCFLEYEQVMRQRAVVDASRVGELEDIVKEAKALDCYLREKKEQLKHSLALISEKLQG